MTDATAPDAGSSMARGEREPRNSARSQAAKQPSAATRIAKAMPGTPAIVARMQAAAVAWTARTVPAKPQEGDNCSRRELASFKFA
jgi:hypothetical protein